MIPFIRVSSNVEELSVIARSTFSLFVKKSFVFALAIEVSSKSSSESLVWVRLLDEVLKSLGSSSQIKGFSSIVSYASFSTGYSGLLLFF